MTTDRSIAFVTGTGDLLNLRIYLDNCEIRVARQHLYIVLLGNKSNISLKHLAACYCFVMQHFVDSRFAYIESTEEDYLSKLFKHLGLSLASRFEELFLFHVFGKTESNIARLVSVKKTVLLENGIATYDPPKARLKQSQQVDVNEAWLPLYPALGNPYYLNRDLVKIPSAIQYQEATKRLRNANITNKEFEVFVVGTSLYRLGIVTLDEEINVYFSYIEKLVSNNVKNILWKPHPRMQASDLSPFKDFENVTVIEDDMPIELSFSYRQPSVAFSASIASSALLSGWIYFGIEPIILDANLTGLERFPHIRRIQQTIPALKK